MKQIIAGMSTATSTSAARWCSPGGASAWSNGINNHYMIFPEAGVLSLLRVDQDAAPGAGKSYTYEIIKNGVAQSLSVAIADAAVTGEDTSNTVTIAAGDVIAIRCTPAGTPTAYTAVQFSTQFEPTTSQIAFWATGGDSGAPNTAAARYALLGAASGASWDATESGRRAAWHINATITSFAFWISNAPGVGKTWTVTIYKNGSAEASSVGVISGAASTSVVVTGLSIDVAPGDDFSVEAVPAGTPAGGTASWGVGYTPDTDGEWAISGSTNALGTAAGPVYLAPHSSWNQFGTSATENLRIEQATAATGAPGWSVSSIRVTLATAPGAGKSRTVTVNKNGSGTALTVTVSETDIEGTASADVSFVYGDTWSIALTSSGTPAASAGQWALFTTDLSGGTSRNLLLLGVG